MDQRGAFRLEADGDAGAGEPRSVVANECDIGRAFDPDQKSGGRGLANMLARASLIDAKVAWDKRASGGTVFTLRKSLATPSVAN